MNTEIPQNLPAYFEAHPDQFTKKMISLRRLLTEYSF